LAALRDLRAHVELAAANGEVRRLALGDLDDVDALATRDVRELPLILGVLLP
jgi:hypothetical protein